MSSGLTPALIASASLALLTFPALWEVLLYSRRLSRTSPLGCSGGHAESSRLPGAREAGCRGSLKAVL